MYLKIHDTKNGRVVAVCDGELLGKTFQEGEIVLDLDTYNSFYNGKKTDEIEVKTALQSFSSANLVGKKSIALAINLRLISKNNVMYVDGIPYVHIYKI